MIELIKNNISEGFIFYIFLMLTIINIISIKTWIENQFFYINNNKPKESRIYSLIGEVLILLWVISIIILIKK